MVNPLSSVTITRILYLSETKSSTRSEMTVEEGTLGGLCLLELYLSVERYLERTPLYPGRVEVPGKSVRLGNDPRGVGNPVVPT